jgi:nicotinate-nucleotide adenylyltransferase
MHKNIGLFFGSFNPIHIGHLLLATHMREAAALDEVWFIVSPQNPFKKCSELADEQHRLEMVKLATEKVEYFKVSDIEFQLEKPSYTHITLKELSKKYPEYTFHLIIGEDNVAKFHKWKEADFILENYKVLVYRRQVNQEKIQDSRFTTYDLPIFDISSTNIRNRILTNQTISFFVTQNVEQFIMFHKLYQ